MSVEQDLDWLLAAYREDYPEAAEGTLYEMLRADVGPGSPLVALLAERLRAEIERSLPPEPARAIDPFYRSFEWRRLRWQVLQRDGRRCRVCGRTAADGIVINVDHIRPRKHFPALALDPGNLQVLCNECNHGKGNLVPAAAARSHA